MGIVVNLGKAQSGLNKARWRVSWGLNRRIALADPLFFGALKNHSSRLPVKAGTDEDEVRVLVATTTATSMESRWWTFRDRGGGNGGG